MLCSKEAFPERAEHAPIGEGVPCQFTYVFVTKDPNCVGLLPSLHLLPCFSFKQAHVSVEEKDTGF